MNNKINVLLSDEFNHYDPLIVEAVISTIVWGSQEDLLQFIDDYVDDACERDKQVLFRRTYEEVELLFPYLHNAFNNLPPIIDPDVINSISLFHEPHALVVQFEAL